MLHALQQRSILRVYNDKINNKICIHKNNYK